MIALRRTLAQCSKHVRPATTRRYASGGAHHGDHGHAGPKTESLGTQFYVVIAAIPISVGVYTLSKKSADGSSSGFTTIINRYSDFKDQWAARNTLHTNAIEQAAFDRNLFHNTRGDKHVNLKYPEVFNTGSPYNVLAGQGPRNLDQLVAHYTKLNTDAEEAKIKALSE